MRHMQLRILGSNMLLVLVIPANAEQLNGEKKYSRGLFEEDFNKNKKQKHQKNKPHGA